MKRFVQSKSIPGGGNESVWHAISGIIENINDNKRPALLRHGDYPDFLSALTANDMETVDLPDTVENIMQPECKLFSIQGQVPFAMVSEDAIIVIPSFHASKRLQYEKGNLTSRMHSSPSASMLYTYNTARLSQKRPCIIKRHEQGLVFDIPEDDDFDFSSVGDNFKLLPLNISCHPEVVVQASRRCRDAAGPYLEMTEMDFFNSSIILGEADADIEQQHNEIIEQTLKDIYDDAMTTLEQDTTGTLIVPIDYPYRTDVKFYPVSRASILVLDNNKNLMGGIIQRNRFVLEEARGNGLGVELVLFSERTGILNTLKGGYYSKSGYATREKAFQILKDEEASLKNGLPLSRNNTSFTP